MVGSLGAEQPSPKRGRQALSQPDVDGGLRRAHLGWSVVGKGRRTYQAHTKRGGKGGAEAGKKKNRPPFRGEGGYSWPQ